MWAALGMMLASAAIQQKMQADAAKRKQDVIRNAQERLTASRNQATDAAMKRVQDFDPGNRQKEQDKITSEMTTKFQEAANEAPITAQGVQVGQTLAEGAGSSDYLANKAREATKAADSNRALASLFGRIGSAGQLRRNEAVRLGDTAGEIGRIQTGANNMYEADQLGFESAGAPDAGGMMIGSILGQMGAAKMMGGMGGGKYAGASTNPSAANYTNSTDRMNSGGWLR